MYYFPAGVLTPIPPCAYYFSDRIRSSTDTEAKFEDYIPGIDYAQLFAACWWHEVESGRRWYIVPEETILWLVDQLRSHHVIYVETSNGSRASRTILSWMLEGMREAREAQIVAYHNVTFPATTLPASFSFT